MAQVVVRDLQVQLVCLLLQDRSLHQRPAGLADNVLQQEVRQMLLLQLLLRQTVDVVHLDRRALAKEPAHQARRMHGRVKVGVAGGAVVHQARHQVDHHGDDRGADDDAKHYLDELVVLLKKTNHA